MKEINSPEKEKAVLKDYYKKVEDPYFHEPCDTCAHKLTDVEKAPCLRCVHYYKRGKKMSEEIKVKGKMIYETKPDRGFIFKAWETDSKGDAIIEVERDGKIIRNFIFPAYKVWNIPAHANDIIESELINNIDGYIVAGSDGLGGNVFR